MPLIPAELREDNGEIEAALEGKLPDLVSIEDIKGDLHVHTKWSDGSHTLEAIVQGAQKKGYQYIAVTDHTKGLGVAHGLDEARLAEEIKVIDGINKKLTGFRILKGTEVDIRSDGSLDLSDEALAGLDIVVASVHSGFKQSREQITGRVLSAIRHPCVSVIAHPTGRLIGEREAYPLDLEAVFKEAARYGVALEINAYPLRLDLNDLHLRRAKDYGVSLVISTDAHLIDQYNFMAYGVSVARRGWVEKKDVLNTLDVDSLLKKLKSCRAGKARPGR
jgi:DNA polymerase (family 10)